jgi:rhodanese-related sulfurtransferase
MSILFVARAVAALGILGSAAVPPILAQSSLTIGNATLGESSPITPEISTTQLKQLMAQAKTPLLDVRSAQEYAIAHIPGSVNYYEKEVERITAAYPERGGALILYCNGPYCGKSKRLSEELVQQGYTNIRRYQLGLPVWRALGNTVETDLAGVRYVLARDKTAVWVDARSREAHAKGRIPGAVNIRKGEAESANEDGRLPRKDKGTRVIVFGDSPDEARKVAEEIAHKAYWNSSYFSGRYADLASMASR